MIKKRRKKKSNKYFTIVHENAILKYIGSEDQNFRNQIYRNVIQPVFKEMINKIVFTYKFTNLPNVETLKDECETHLVTILSNFDPSKGSKAFSYFSVITKNWFIAKVKKTAIRLRREAHYDRWENQNLKENERKILEAIKILFTDADAIEIFNKKAIYLYIREITNLNTKQVLNNLNKFRLEYGSFKKKWNK